MKNFLFLKPYLAPVKWVMLLAVVLMTLESFSFLAIIGLQQRLIDDILRAGQYDQALEVIILFATAFLMYAILFTFGPHTMHKMIARIQQQLSKKFMSYLYRIPTAKLQKERTATYVHYISQDIMAVSSMAGQQIPRGIQQLISAVFVMVIIGIASPIILLCSIMISAVYVLIGKYFSNRLKKAAKEVQETKSALLVHIEEGISSTREVIAYHRMQWEERIYRTFFQKYYDKVMHEGKIDNMKMITSEPLNWGVRLFILGYGGYLVLQGQLSIGMFVVIFQYGTQLVQMFQNLFNFIMQLSNGSASIERLRLVMGGEQWEEGTKTIEHPIRSIRFNQIDFHYDENKPVLQDFSLDLPLGKKIAFVGTSGGGKSTITQLLIRFFNPNSGQILINELPMNTWKRKEWMDRVGIVFQEPYLFPDTIRNNLLLGVENIDDDHIRQACRAAQIDDFMMSLPEQYETIIGDRGITLSGGQRQRLAIARTLLRDPEILILDEATSALDQITERHLQDAIDQMRKGKTTIIVAHRLSTVKNADIIYVMHQGKAVEQGTHEELVSCDSHYRDLVYHEENEKYGVKDVS